MTAQGLMGKGVPAGMPPFLLYIKIAIMVLSLIILALAAYSIAIWNQYTGYGYYYSSGISGLLIFVVIKTWIIYGIFLALEFKAPHLYYRIAAIIGYVLSVIFWLSAWAWAASIASLWLGAYNSYYDYGIYGNTANPFKGYGAALAACAGLGAVVWVLSIVHLVLFARACMNDNSTITHSQAELGQVNAQKHEATTNVYAAPAPAPVYAAPAGYQQAYPQQQYAQPQQTYATQ